ncbi:hypothetical protein [Flavobacterium cerinum]|uniref:Anti-sigma factor n=1 Tax=Flavobacterium cerinum TaxID=2502784 RepID=A0ABY5ISM0_9FLAO|nr:hypothetical protein [Flavobacterium cerinum]UUC45789.1 hypothetical protein NOX80_00940 [Flavobacterium cerinum]
MEPNKLEDDFRDKLSKRAIQPSEMAWDRLDVMLSVAENKKPKRNYSWLYIAATFIGLLFVGVFLMNREKEVIKIQENTVKMVEKQPETETESGENGIIPEPKELLSEAGKTGAATNRIVSEKLKKNELNEKGFTAPEQVREVQEPETYIAEVTPQPKEVKKGTSTVDANALLASVEKGDTKSVVKVGRQNVKVDANSLLNTVEGEITTDYREGVFQTINRNFKTVKSAVANRNQE